MDIQKRFRRWRAIKEAQGRLVMPNSAEALFFLHEEIGEVQSVYNHMYLTEFVRNNPMLLDRDALRRELAKELCDVVFMTMTFAQATGIDLDEVLEKYLEEERT